MVVHMPWEEFRPSLTIAVDSDFAGCRETRRSTCGGCVLWGKALIKAWSKTMDILALSSGESELAALTKACTEGIGIQSLLADFQQAGPWPTWYKAWLELLSNIWQHRA